MIAKYKYSLSLPNTLPLPSMSQSVSPHRNSSGLGRNVSRVSHSNDSPWPKSSLQPDNSSESSRSTSAGRIARIGVAPVSLPTQRIALPAMEWRPT